MRLSRRSKYVVRLFHDASSRLQTHIFRADLFGKVPASSSKNSSGSNFSGGAAELKPFWKTFGKMAPPSCYVETMK